MTLSARIAIGPSRRLLIAATGLLSGGIAVAAMTAVARRPEATAAIVAIACIVGAASTGRRVLAHRRIGVHTLTWSEHADIAVQHARADVAETVWRLAPPSMTWSGAPFGLSVLALASPAAESARAIVLPVLHLDLAPRERRAWQRRLLWALRGGDQSSVGT